MRTNIVIDNTLMRVALDLSGLATKRAAVEMGLRLLIQLHQQKQITKFRGKLKWHGDLDAMRADK